MIIKQTDVELTVENGKPTKCLLLGNEISERDAVKLYELDKSHKAAGEIYGEPFTDLNAILAAKDLEESDKKHFKITEIIDAPAVEWVEGRVY